MNASIFRRTFTSAAALAVAAVLTGTSLLSASPAMAQAPALTTVNAGFVPVTDVAALETQAPDPGAYHVLLSHNYAYDLAALQNLLASLRERLVVARKARSVGELLRNQIDLLPDTHARLLRDHSVRGQLLKGFTRDLRGSFGFKRVA